MHTAKMWPEGSSYDSTWIKLVSKKMIDHVILFFPLNNSSLWAMNIHCDLATTVLKEWVTCGLRACDAGSSLLMNTHGWHVCRFRLGTRFGESWKHWPHSMDYPILPFGLPLRFSGKKMSIFLHLLKTNLRSQSPLGAILLSPFSGPFYILSLAE